MKIKILIPVYNDWQSVYKLVEKLIIYQLIKNLKFLFIYLMMPSNHDRPTRKKF